MPWTWHAHPDVWLVVGALGGSYWWALRRLGPRYVPAGEPAATRGQVLAFLSGVFALWLGADWPVHELSEGYLFSVHMTQHLIFTLVAPPLLLLGTPAWLMRHLIGQGRFFRVFRVLARPVPALVVFNGLLIVTHWPALVDLTLRSEGAHFVAHAAIFTSALLMWCPVVAPLPELRLVSPPGQMLYLFLNSVTPTVPASFLVFAEDPIYRFYDNVPRLWGISAVEDQRIAGLLMKLGGGLILWAIITGMFFMWHAREERAEQEARRWRELDHEIEPRRSFR
jgi:putative membrane protein